ncbi:unnamed protein product [Sphagnum jensenii]|uniref:Uncharacterized protein n=1 Tax=Sphagnum jensenii TaxID=128206 RepID=A0ABP1BWP7_9BRYO
MSIRVRVPRERAASKCCSGCLCDFSGVWSMETHQSMEQERGFVLPSKPQLLQQNVLEEERVHRPHLCNDRLEDIVQVLKNASQEHKMSDDLWKQLPYEDLILP